MSRRAVTDARRDPRLHRFGRHWTKQDDRALTHAWGEFQSLTHLATHLGRSPASVYWRARELGLKRGAPEGTEYLTHAANRCGYSTAQLTRILRWAGVSIHRTLSRPGRAATRGYHYVDPLDTDDAVIAWLATEPLYTAATRHGLTAETVERLLREHGVTRPKRKRNPKGHWRVESALVDELVSAYRKRKSEYLSIGRHAERLGVYRHTLAKWLQRAGVAPANLTNRGCRLPADVVDRVVAEHAAKHPKKWKPHAPPIVMDGERLTFRKWCERFGISDRTVRSRMRLGLSFEEALKTPLHPGRRAA
jgi:hypothetical protein